MGRFDVSANTTTDMRRGYLKSAIAARKERATVKKRINSGELTIADVLGMESKYVKRMYVVDLLSARRGCGKAGALKLMKRLKIGERRRISGLGPNQRKRLLEAVEKGQ